MIHIYPKKDLRAYPGVLRGTDDWDNTYKIRTAVERDINHINVISVWPGVGRRMKKLYMLI